MAALLSAAPRAWAADATAPEVAPATETGVRVHLMGELGRDTKLRQLLAEWLGANGVRYEVVQQVELRLEDIKAPRGSGPPIRIWVVAIGATLARLYFAEPDAQRYLVRDVPLASGFDEVGREQIVQVVLASTLAFTDRAADSSLAELEQALPPRIEPVAAKPSGPRTSEPAQAPTAVRAQVQPRRHPDEWSRATAAQPWTTGMGLGVLYGATDKGEEGVAHGPGVSVELGRGNEVLGLAVRIHGQYRFDRRVSSDRVELEVREGVVAGSAALRVQPAGPVCWRAELGAGAQLLRIDPHAKADTVQARRAVNDQRPFVMVAVGPAWRAHGGWIRLSARLDVQLSHTRYDVRAESETQQELAVKRVQPGMFVEVGGEPIHF